ncbi:MAG: hypothetical protein HKN18_02010 [Silicimonas sp.]|nr:hypothetical protein [Silicimonas sp.]
MSSDKILVLCPREAISLDPPAARPDASISGAPYAEDAVEDVVVCLASIEAAWAAGEFQRLKGTLASVRKLARDTGLKDLVVVAAMAEHLVTGQDEVALAAVIARLVRVGEASLATLLEISYHQI